MKTIKVARSKKNGIIFYSSVVPWLAINSFVAKDGQIKTTFLIDFVDSLSSTKTICHKNTYLLFIFQIIFVLSSILFLNIYPFIAVIFTCLFSPVWYHFACLAISYKFGKRQNLSRFHAAEHMAINAYCKLQRIPTLKEIRNSSRFSENCGSMHILNACIPTLLFTLCFISGTFLHPLLFIFVLLVFSIFNFVLLKFKLLKFLQFFFTSKPTDLELEVALKGIQVYDDVERQIAQGEMDFSVIIHDNNIFPIT